MLRNLGSGMARRGLPDTGSNLAGIAHESQAQPEAAKGCNLTFKPRNATFGDGRRVTARDVIASVNHHRDDATLSGAKGMLVHGPVAGGRLLDGGRLAECRFAA